MDDSRTERARRLQPSLDREYIEPILLKSMQILELLANEPTGLRIEQIHHKTNICKSTVYRIVRTLVVCDCLVRNGIGTYSIATGAVLPPGILARSAQGVMERRA